MNIVNRRRLGLGPKSIKRDDGNSAVEFALILPLLMTILFGIIKFGLVMGNYIQLIDGVRAGARGLAQARGSATPYTSTLSTLSAGAPGLTSANIGKTITVNGTACATDSDCKTAFGSATPGTTSATLTATYSCDLVVFTYNFAPGCQLSASTSELIE